MVCYHYHNLNKMFSMENQPEFICAFIQGVIHASKKGRMVVTDRQFHEQLI